GGVHFERRVLRRRAEEDDVAVLDVREDDVLLRLVEAVDLVDEEDGALVREAADLARFLDELSKLRDAARHGGDPDEARLRHARRDRREGRLPGPRRSPQDHRRDLPRVERLSQEAALADDVLLPDELREVTRPHARREGLRLRHSAILSLVPNRSLPPARRRERAASLRRARAQEGGRADSRCAPRTSPSRGG